VLRENSFITFLPEGLAAWFWLWLGGARAAVFLTGIIVAEKIWDIFRGEKVKVRYLP
jgi:hypothetical protein